MLKWASVPQNICLFFESPFAMTVLKEVCRGFFYYRHREAFFRFFAEKAVAIPPMQQRVQVMLFSGSDWGIAALICSVWLPTAVLDIILIATIVPFEEPFAMTALTPTYPTTCALNVSFSTPAAP